MKYSDVFEKFFQKIAESHKTNWGFVTRSKNYSFDYFLVKAAHFVFNQGNRGKNKKTKCLKKFPTQTAQGGMLHFFQIQSVTKSSTHLDD